MKLKYFYIN